jgi:chemotaxis protein MotB
MESVIVRSRAIAAEKNASRKKNSHALRRVDVEGGRSVPSPTMTKFLVWSGMTMMALAVAGCGHTDEEMAAKQREIDKLAADLKAAKAQIADDQAKFSDAQNSIEKMKEQLKQAGLSLDRSQGEQQKLTQALAEYKQRADQLAVIEQRFRELRQKLDKLNQVGVKVVPRNNRLVVQLPGDILFDSGKDELKQSGKEVLAQVAEVIRNDKDLNNRYFVVAGHTDNVKYPPGGPFGDNWGLSLARARRVTLFLTDDKKADPKKKGDTGGGGLNPRRWSAAGYAEFDPLAGSVEQQSKDDQQKNRRVELVVQPNVEEMLNLSTIK